MSGAPFQGGAYGEFTYGEIASTATAHSVALDAASYTFTAQAVSLELGREIVVGAASYSFTPQAVALELGREIVIGAASYAFTAQNVALNKGKTLALAAASYSFTAQAVSLEKSWEVAVAAASYSFSAQAVAAELGREIVAGAAAYGFTPSDITFTLATPLSNITAPVARGPVGGATEEIGAVLSVTNGTWESASPLTFAYQWRRNGTNIAGATLNAYTLQRADSGAAIDCNVTATNAVASRSQDSNNITCETSTHRVRTRYLKVVGRVSGTPLMNWTEE